MGKHKSQAPKVNLAVAGNTIRIDDEYAINFAPENYIIVKAGVLCGKPATAFTHPNVAKKTNTMLSFKRYFRNGSKKWYEKAGVDFFFIVPKSAINIHVDTGFSFVDAEINGVNVTFNVTGGSFGDWVGTQAEIFCNHTSRDLKRIAEVSIRDAEIEKTIVSKDMDEGEKRRWSQQSTRKNKTVLETLVKMMEDGKNPTIKVAEGYGVGNVDEIKGELYAVSRRKKRVFRYDENKKVVGWSYDYAHGVVKAVAIRTSVGNVHAKLNQIDWVNTAKMNGIIV